MKNFWVESHRDANEEHSRGEEHAGRSHERDIPTAKRDYSSFLYRPELQVFKMGAISKGQEGKM